MKNTIKLTLASIVIFANVASAVSIRFDGSVFGGPPSPDQNWTTAVNWNGDVVPGINDDAHINVTGSGIALLDSDVGTIANLNVGVDESGTLDVTTGGVLTTTPGGFSSLGIGGGTNTGTLNLSGGILTFNESFLVGVNDNSTGILNISSGSMRVNGQFFHNVSNTAAIAQTVLSGGLLDVNSMILNSGVFDVAGGTLRLRNGNQTSQVATWAGSGRMIANGGTSSLSAVYDPGNNWTTVTAVAPPASYRFDGGVFGGASPDKNWTTPGNWDPNAVPGVIDNAHINVTGSGIALLDSDVGTIANLRVGLDESGTLDVPTGGVLTTTPGDFSGLGIGGGTNTGTLNLSGGTLTFNEIFFVAQGGASTGLLNITSGSMRVADQFIHNVDSQPNAIAQTVLTGGLLDVNSMTLNSGTFNVAGGTLRLRNGDQRSQVATWAGSGRMIANGGTSSLSAVYDPGNNWTTVTVATPAFTGNGTLTLLTPATGVNKLNVTVSAGGLTDTDICNATGTVGSTINADPTTGATMQMTLSGGSISLSNMRFVLGSVFVPVADVSTSGLGGTAFTPAPPAPVTPNASGGSFSGSLVRLLINRGTMSGTALGSPVSLNFASSPIQGPGTGTGTISMVAGAADSTHRTFQATVTMPVDFTQVQNLSGTSVTMRVRGTIKAAGPVRIPLNAWSEWTSANGLAGASFSSPLSPGAAPLGLAWATGQVSNVPASALTPAMQSASPAPRAIVTLPPTGTRAPVWVEFSDSLASESWTVAPSSSLSNGKNPLPIGILGNITVQLPTGTRSFTRLRAQQP